MAESLKGIIERVTFHNPENGFAVLRVQVPGRPELVTAVGHLATAVAGEYLEASGQWVQDKEHGLQFRADNLSTTPPQSATGIERYLGSGLVRGIGPHFARKIVQVFGERTLTVIDESPAYLREVKGIGPRRVQRIREGWHEQKLVRAILMFLQSHGVGNARAVRIYREYGDKAIELIQENPYRLASDIWGVGFKTADHLAQRLGVDPQSPVRARAAVQHVLRQLSNEGHCGFPESAVVERTVQLTQIALETVARAIEDSRDDGEVVRDEERPEPWLYLKSLYLAEQGVARRLSALCEGSHPLTGIDSERALRWVEEQMSLELAAAQRGAIRQAISQKVLVVTGGPGVGKTTIVRGILDVFSAKGLRCALCAPTGRAAKRLGETTGQEAKTIHRLLEFDPAVRDFKRQRENPLELDLLVVDETSMVDVVLMNQLLRAVPGGACLVLVGDVDQLPSVGPGAVLADIIGSGAVPVIRLTQVFRQAESSWIVRAAHRVNQGRMPEPSPDERGDFFIVPTSDPAKIADQVITLVRDRIPARFGLDPLRDIQVLSPMNRSELGARNLNARLQEALNPASGGTSVERFGWTFRVGDKVLQTINNYTKEIYNGDIGRVCAIDAVDHQLTVDFDGRVVPYDFGELDELVLGYALTIHKGQGAEYPAVVIPLHTQHFMMLERNLLYTGITRGRRVVVIVGPPKAVRLAALRHETRARCSALSCRLEQFSRKESGRSRPPVAARTRGVPR
jgi:exodeoxyribonuclease V alpha subunit